MALFVIAVAAVAAAILWLWVTQRRERGSVESIDGFRSSLEKLSTPTDAEREFFADTGDRSDDHAPDLNHEHAPDEGREAVAPRASSPAPRVDHTPLAPLTPERRAAARERIAQRRRAMRSGAAR